MSDPAVHVNSHHASMRSILIIVLASVILTLSMGVRQSLGLFQGPIRADLGVSASAFGMAMAIQSLVWGLGQPVIGMLGDRFGARPVLVGSALIYAVGLLLMATSQPSMGLDLGCGVVAGIGVAGTGFGVLIGAVSAAVPPERRSQTVGLVSAAGSLGTIVIAPFGQMMIGEFGWRNALLAFVGIAVAIAFISIAIGGKAGEVSPGSSTAPVDNSSTMGMLKHASGHRGYVAMSVAFFACGFQLMFILTHLPQYLTICGISPATSAKALGLIGLGNAVGSYIFGRLGARFSQRKLLSSIYILRTVTILAFLSVPVNEVSTYAFAAAMGLLWLGVLPLVGGLISSMFGMRHFNTLFGVVFLSHQIGSYLGAWIGGLIFDITGSYANAWTAMVVIGFSAATLQWFMDDRPRPIHVVPQGSPA